MSTVELLQHGRYSRESLIPRLEESYIPVPSDMEFGEEFLEFGDFQKVDFLGKTRKQMESLLKDKSEYYPYIDKWNKWKPSIENGRYKREVNKVSKKLNTRGSLNPIISAYLVNKNSVNISLDEGILLEEFYRIIKLPGISFSKEKILQYIIFFGEKNTESVLKALEKFRSLPKSIDDTFKDHLVLIRNIDKGEEKDIISKYENLSEIYLTAPSWLIAASSIYSKSPDKLIELYHTKQYDILQ